MPINLPSEILDRLPPQSMESEKCALGSVLHAADALEVLAKLLEPSDFYADANQRIYRVMLSLDDRRKPFDALAISEELKRIGEYEAAGGTAYIYELHCIVPYGANARYFAEIVLRHSKMRKIIHAAQETLRSAWTSNATPEDTLAIAEQALQEIKTGRYETDPVSMETAVMAALDLAERAITRQEHLGVPSGFEALDQEVGGFFPAELSILAARTGIGKTSLAMQYAVNAARRGRRIYIATLEMRFIEVAMKLLCSAAGVKVKAVRTGNASREDLQRMIERACDLSTLPIVLHDWPQLRAYDIRRAARKFKADLIVVDYLTLVTPAEKKGRERYQQVDQIVKDLKATARELQVPVLALAQINRESEKQGKDTRPRLHQLRECGGIEMDADMVLILHRLRGKRLEKTEKGTDGKQHVVEEWDADLEVAKMRLGSETTFRLDWHPDCEQYSEHNLAVPGRADTATNFEPAFQGEF